MIVAATSSPDKRNFRHNVLLMGAQLKFIRNDVVYLRFIRSRIIGDR